MQSKKVHRTSRDRRQTSRLPCRTPVRIYADDDPRSESYILMGSNLSESSVFLHSDFLHDIGDTLQLEYLVPGRALPVRGRGRVVRVETGGGLGPGMAVELG